MLEKIATPVNPIVLYYSDSTPSMKNENVIQVAGGRVTGIGRSKSVQRFLNVAPQTFKTQRERQQFEIIQRPRRVGVFAQIGVFISPNSESKISKQDEDNMYTSLQECLQGSVIEDDNQVLFHAVTTFPVVTKKSAFAFAFVWEVGEIYTVKIVETFINFYNDFYKDKRITDFLRIVG